MLFKSTSHAICGVFSYKKLNVKGNDCGLMPTQYYHKVLAWVTNPLLKAGFVDVPDKYYSGTSYSSY